MGLRFLQVFDIWFRPIFAFFMIELGSRKVVQVGVTRRPWPPWVAQQLRNATPFGVGPRFLIRDRDDNYKCGFDQVASSIGTRILKTPVNAPNANGVCERFLGTVRRECIDHVLVLDEQHLMDVLVEFCAYYNDARPHQAIGHFIPAGESGARGECGASTAVVVGRAVLNGLHTGGSRSCAMSTRATRRFER